VSACDCPYCAPADAEAPEAETAHEPVELPDKPRQFRVHVPGLFPQDCTLHPDGTITMTAGRQLWHSAFSFEEMREMGWEHARIEWDPPPLAKEPTPSVTGPAQPDLFAGAAGGEAA
jgi:hypothetical protein